MKANILGTEYEVLYKNYNDEPYFEKYSCDGYCDSVTKQIVLCTANTHPYLCGETERYRREAQKTTIRHEIIHAFLNESGLQDNSGVITNKGWARNEEMVDFFAIQFPKIQKVFEKLNVI